MSTWRRRDRRPAEHELGLHDELTKLPNRTLFRDRLEGALARSVRRRSSCAVLSVDIDRFQRINDTLGLAIGDRVLRDVATRLDGCLRPEDSVARTGGDEFMVLIETEEPEPVAERIAAALHEPFVVDGHELYVTASVGIAIGRGGRDRPEDVLQNADVAMHRAKDNGRARHELFRQEMTPHPRERLGIETELRRAVDRDEFFVEYQPEVDLAGGQVVAVEALVRWRHPERGVVAPDEFVPVAEETGLILTIGRRVLAEACGLGRPVSVNLSKRELHQPRVRLVDEVTSALHAGGMEPGDLCLEITERAAMEDVDAAVEAMEALRQVGVRLALDDFGAGTSSLGYLRRIPVDVVKLDRAFVNEMLEPLVHAVAEICHALDVKVVAEGVDTAEQARRLQELGCDRGQGEWFSQPVPATRLPGRGSTGGPLAGPPGSPALRASD